MYQACLEVEATIVMMMMTAIEREDPINRTRTRDICHTIVGMSGGR